MYSKQEIIIQHYRLGKSQRQISHDLGIGRKTVKRYIEELERLQRVNNYSESSGLLSASLSKPASYTPLTGFNRKPTQEIADHCCPVTRKKEEAKAEAIASNELTL